MTEGAGVTVQDKARGYYYGGWLTNSSVPGYQSRTALRNMLVYDILANSFRNQSGPDDIPRAEGVMIYLPAGDSGLLVYFGGIQFPYGNETAEAVGSSSIKLLFRSLIGAASNDCTSRIGWKFFVTQAAHRISMCTISGMISGTSRGRVGQECLRIGEDFAQEPRGRMTAHLTICPWAYRVL
jgi:hypothetical protein